MDLPTPKRLQAPTTTSPEATRKTKGKRWASRGANLVLPGLGQLLEGRYAAGAVFLALALSGFLLVLVPVVQILLVYAQTLMALVNDTPEPPASALNSFGLHIGMMVGGLAVVLLAYVWSIADAGRSSPAELPHPPETWDEDLDQDKS